MRRLLIGLVLLPVAASAQSDIADEVAALRQLVESQNRLITEQSAQLQQLTNRVTELEGEAAVSEVDAPGVVAMQPEPAPSRQATTIAVRTEPVDADEIGQPLRRAGIGLIDDCDTGWSPGGGFVGRNDLFQIELSDVTGTHNVVAEDVQHSLPAAALAHAVAAQIT